jgi:hypothetical protein
MYWGYLVFMISEFMESDSGEFIDPMPEAAPKSLKYIHTSAHNWADTYLIKDTYLECVSILQDFWQMGLYAHIPKDGSLPDYILRVCVFDNGDISVYLDNETNTPYVTHTYEQMYTTFGLTPPYKRPTAV